jgi:rhodanese-related sulfurtransferase
MQSIKPEQLKELLDRGGSNARLVDVREPWEFEICRIEGSENIPMSELPARLGAFDKDQPTVIICHHGARSLQVAEYLSRSGFTQVMNLEGGVNAWALTVDPDMEQY